MVKTIQLYTGHVCSWNRKEFWQKFPNQTIDEVKMVKGNRNRWKILNRYFFFVIGCAFRLLWQYIWNNPDVTRFCFSPNQTIQTRIVLAGIHIRKIPTHCNNNIVRTCRIRLFANEIEKCFQLCWILTKKLFVFHHKNKRSKLCPIFESKKMKYEWNLRCELIQVHANEMYLFVNIIFWAWFIVNYWIVRTQYIETKSRRWTVSIV